MGQRLTELRDCDREHEVEEQLERRRVALLNALKGPQAWRVARADARRRDAGWRPAPCLCGQIDGRLGWRRPGLEPDRPGAERPVDPITVPSEKAERT